MDSPDSSFESERVRLEEDARTIAHLLRVELSRVEAEEREKREEERISRLVDEEIKRLHEREAVRELAEKTRLDLLYRTILQDNSQPDMPVFETCTDLRFETPAADNCSFDVDALLRKNRNRLQVLDTMFPN